MLQAGGSRRRPEACSTSRELGWGNPAKRAVGSELVVVSPPGPDAHACVLEIGEPVHVEALRSHLVVEALDERILHRLVV